MEEEMSLCEKCNCEPANTCEKCNEQESEEAKLSERQRIVEILKKNLPEILREYRVKADGIYSEVRDKFHTQKQYEIALKNLVKYCLNNLIKELGEK